MGIIVLFYGVVGHQLSLWRVVLLAATWYWYCNVPIIWGNSDVVITPFLLLNPRYKDSLATWGWLRATHGPTSRTTLSCRRSTKRIVRGDPECSTNTCSVERRLHCLTAPSRTVLNSAKYTCHHDAPLCSKTTAGSVRLQYEIARYQLGVVLCIVLDFWWLYHGFYSGSKKPVPFPEGWECGNPPWQSNNRTPVSHNLTFKFINKFVIDN